MTAWSHSLLNGFETCPRRHYLTRVTKQVSEPQTEATTHGNEVHKAIELHLKGEKGLPEKYKQYAPLVNRCAQAQGKKLVEWKFALTDKLKETGYFAKDVWCRGVIDFGVVTPTKASVVDWKTGKPKPDSDQLKLFAGVVFAAFPHVQTVDTGFAWLAHKRFDREVFHRRDIPVIWNTFLPKVARLEAAEKNNDWPPRPSGLCGKWCPVPRALCEFSGRA